MIVYRDRSFCYTIYCKYFNKDCDKRYVANKELLQEADDFGLPVDLRVYDMDKDDIPLGCHRFEELESGN